MEARAGRQDRHGGGIREEARLGKAIAFRIAPGAGDEIDQDQLRHVGQHQAGQDLAGIEAGAQEGGDGGPGHAPQRACEDHGGQQQRAGAVVEEQGEAAAGERPHGVLPLGADVPDIGPEAEGKAGADED
jgi:hypothetical protein